MRRVVATVAIAAFVLVCAIAVTRTAVDAQSKNDAGGAAFAVASVKRNVSGTTNVMISAPPGGQFRAINIPLRTLIQSAYGLQDFQIVNTPSWIETERFDILAKAETDTTPEQTSALLRKLLADRFQLAAHTEERQLPVYALVVARKDGKLGDGLQASSVDCAAVADRARERARDGAQPPRQRAGLRPTCGSSLGPGVFTAGAFTLEEFARRLSTVSDISRVVLDKTGLSGNFDIDLKWTPMPTSMSAAAQSGPGGADRIGNDGPSIFTALQEQLGLKLASQKGPVIVLVIDRVEHPTAN
jgi:uncharacterized protein (TIGR03435 family)